MAHSESNPISVTAVWINDAEEDSSNWSFDSTTNKVTINTAMSVGDSVEIKYTYYSNYSNTEIENYVRSALIQISASNYKDFIVESGTIYPEPTSREKNMIATIAGILISPDNMTYRLPDMSVVVQKDVPTYDKIRKVIAAFKQNTHGYIEVL